MIRRSALVICLANLLLSGPRGPARSHRGPLVGAVLLESSRESRRHVSGRPVLTGLAAGRMRGMRPLAANAGKWAWPENVATRLIGIYCSARPVHRAPAIAASASRPTAESHSSTLASMCLRNEFSQSRCRRLGIVRADAEARRLASAIVSARSAASAARQPRQLCSMSM